LKVREDGTMLYDVGQRGLNSVTWDELREVLVLEADYNPELIVLAKVDRKAKYEAMVDLLDTFSDAQMSRFSVIPMTEEDKAIAEGM
jgi:biopolymer transport protein ExbD